MPKLKAPSKAQRAAGLPTSKAEAVKAGLTRFIPEDGAERVIRKYGTEKYPVGTVETAASRKGNRGGGTGGSRAINEALATPEGADSKAYGKAMADANAQGMDGDHIREVSRTANGIRYKEESGRGTRQQYHNNMKKAGVAVGNQADNVQPLPPKVNQGVKPAQLRAMDNGIKSANGSFKGISIKNGMVSFRANIGPLALEFLPVVDELTGGHLNRNLQRGLNQIKQAVGFQPNPVYEYSEIPPDPITKTVNGIASAIYDFGSYLKDKQSTQKPLEGSRARFKT